MKKLIKTCKKEVAKKIAESNRRAMLADGLSAEEAATAAAFLATLKSRKSLSAAQAVTGLGDKALDSVVSRSPTFQNLLQIAKAEIVGVLETALHSRAVAKSDTCLLAALRQLAPDRYGDKPAAQQAVVININGVTLGQQSHEAATTIARGVDINELRARELAGS